MRWVLAFLVAAAAPACKRFEDVSRDLGAACRSNDDCTQTCLPAPRWPDGFCSLDCLETNDCPVGADCVDTEADGTVCLFLCFDDRDCAFLQAGTEWNCRRAQAVRVCMPREPQ